MKYSKGARGSAKGMGKNGRVYFPLPVEEVGSLRFHHSARGIVDE